MYVEGLALEDFRNYERAQADLSSGLNLIVGRNAQGKTNVLEAIHVISGLGSPRAPDAALVRDGTERALLHAEVARAGRRLRIDMEITPGKGIEALLNRTPVRTTRALTEVVSCVFFGPDELALVKGAPEARRRFLDELVVKRRPSRYSLRREWERVLRQRNALLRTAPRPMPASTLETLAVWDESLARAGATLTAARLEALAALIPHAGKRYEEVAGGGRLDLGYASTWVAEETSGEALAMGGIDERVLKDLLDAAMARERKHELERGTSLVGPQRDDVSIQLASEQGVLDARVYASQGDQRTTSLALKLGEYDLLVEALGEEPILLLDDVFSELDPSRRSWLARAVRAGGQTLLTSAEPDALEGIDADRVLAVEAGRLSVRE
ncbi:MAG: DNA replication/repair protein RecF [Actinomycetota bacterium]